jgi:hypothetical protein
MKKSYGNYWARPYRKWWSIYDSRTGDAIVDVLHEEDVQTVAQMLYQQEIGVHLLVQPMTGEQQSLF